MLTTWMGPVGLVFAAVGAASILYGNHVLTNCVATLPDPLLQSAAARIGRLEYSVVVIGAAVAVYSVARQLGHGRFGLYVCTTLLLANASVVAALRIRWFDALGAASAIVSQYRRSALLQLAGSWILFLGVATYLLRP